MKKLFTLGVSLAVLLIACDGGGDSSSNIIDNPTSNADTALYESQIHTAINNRRNQNSLSALTRDAQLDAIAAEHSQYLKNSATPNASPIDINHDNFSTRQTAMIALGYTQVAENVGANRGYTSSQVAAQLVDGWIKSPSHYTNLTGNYTHTGISVAVDPRDGTVYATQVFAR